jgi:hypothetical protein
MRLTSRSKSMISAWSISVGETPPSDSYAGRLLFALPVALGKFAMFLTGQRQWSPPAGNCGTGV